MCDKSGNQKKQRVNTGAVGSLEMLVSYVRMNESKIKNHILIAICKFLVDTAPSYNIPRSGNIDTPQT